MPRRSLIRFTARVLPLFLLVLLVAQECFGRAGGGEGYSGHGSGGGGGGDGGGSGHGGGGFIVWMLIQLLFRHPIVGIPVIIIGVVLYFYFRNSIPQSPAGTPSSAMISAAPLDSSQVAGAIAQIRQNDPNFDDQAFYRRVEVAFNKIQAAWSTQDLKSVRPFISDGVHERFTLQFLEQKAEGWRDQMDNVQVHAIEMAQLRSDGLFDELSVRIAASALDYRVSLASGQRTGPPTAPEQFVEIWSFLRHRGAKTTPNKAGLIEGNCPNCGAPVELNQSANCTHCKALLRSGQYDWVLAEITQEVEWDASRLDDVPGAQAMRHRDPEFDAVELEDRASVIFWRKATADRTGKIDPLRKTASEEFCQRYAPTLRGSPDGSRQTFAHCAVGAVQLLGVSSTPQGDRAIVEVRWSGTRVMVGPNRPPQVLEEGHLDQSLFVLWRAPNQKTDAAKGISSAHCPGCGAPVSNSASNACDFCGAVLNDGSHGWILVDIADRNDAHGAQVLAEFGQ